MKESKKNSDAAARKSRLTWVEDIQSLLDVSNNSAQLLYNFLSRYICHLIFEQLLDDPNKKIFDVHIAPIGLVRIAADDFGDSCDIKLVDIKFDPNFKANLINTIKCKESGLFNIEYFEQLRNITNKLEEFKEGRL